jgi:outer membrane immunogenic protein
MLKAVWVATLGVTVAAAGTAVAADIPVKAPIYKAAPTPAPFSWTGFYLGANIGYGWVDDNGRPTCIDDLGVVNGAFCQNVPTGAVDASGVIGGAQIGYNWQSNNLLFGLEADFQGADISGKTVVTGPFSFFNGTLALPAGAQFTASEKIQWFGTVRGRIGWTFDRVLVYGTAGLAYGHAQLRTNFVTPLPFSAPASVSVTNAGWTAGGGIEYAFAGNWSGKIEALYFDLGDEHVLVGAAPGTPPAGAGFRRGKDFELQGAIVRLGLNYRFGPTSVIAKY